MENRTAIKRNSAIKTMATRTEFTLSLIIIALFLFAFFFNRAVTKTALLWTDNKLIAGIPALVWLAGYLLAGRERRWALPAHADGYAGGHFQARLQDGRVVDLAAPDPAIAASAPSGV